ncbi:MAG: rod shape-determining protein RodA [Cytophagaceae bacterium]|jgi:rod shape determining protein RodA|nr:rod shape-determining protein RodA [Cytophagaceae bacterium]
MRSNSRDKKSIDRVTVLLYAILIVAGWLNIYAANMEPDTYLSFNTGKEYFRQLIWIGISLITIGVIMIIDSKFYVEFSYFFYIGAMLLLLIVITPLGDEVNGAHSWFRFGSFSFQPVELAKPAVALTLARLMSRHGFTFRRRSDFLTLFAVWALPVAIIILQNDTGSALVFFAFFVLFFREGLSPFIILFGFIAVIIFVLTLIISNSVILTMLGMVLFLLILVKRGWRREALIFFAVATFIFAIVILISHTAMGRIAYNGALLAGFAGGTVFIIIKAISKRAPFIWMYLLIFWGSVAFTYSTDYLTDKVLSDYQRTRIMVMLGLEDDPLGAGYNVNQSKIAIGSGGLSGKGYLQGTQTKFNFVPKQSTDFIFCTVGEEWGFVGASVVILLFLALLLRLMYVAEQQHSAFSRLFGYGVAGIFFFHFAINIGMTIGLAPVIGIPLPFFSYGGSSLWGFSILLFLFLKLDTDRGQLIG